MKASNKRKIDFYSIASSSPLARDQISQYLIHIPLNTSCMIRLRVCYIIIDFIVQKRRDQYCNDVLPTVCVGKYRARIGMFGISGVRWGCFCEQNLSEDMNFNYGGGDYTLHFNLTAIN